MANLLIFIAEDGTPVQLAFFHRPILNGVSPGIWVSENNEIYLPTESWEFVQSKKGEPRALKPLLDKLKQIPNLGVAPLGLPPLRFIITEPRLFYPKLEWADYKN